MINLEGYKAWVASKGITTPMYLGPSNQPEDPTDCYTVWETGTLGTTLERYADRPTIQVLTRASSGKVCYQKAKALDDLMLDTKPQFLIDGKNVIDMGKISGPFNLGLDSRGRTEFSANYWLEIER